MTDSDSDLNLMRSPGTTLTVVGSGGGSASSERHMPAFLLESGETRFLLDAGYGTLHQLLALGYKTTDLHGICVTHFHGDHFGDVHHILDTIVRQEGKALRPRMIIGPMGLDHRLKVLFDIHKYHQGFFPKEIRLIEYAPGGKYAIYSGTSEEPILVEPFEVNHVRTNSASFPSLGFVCRAGNKKLVYMGDIGPNQNWDSLRLTAFEADLLIIEAGASDDSSEKHITAERAVEFSLKCKAKQTVLNHISPDRVRAVWATIHPLCVDQTVLIAEDEMEIEL